MSEMIERVKAAIAEIPVALDPSVWDHVAGLAARAAIQAMREPTGEMMEAGDDAVFEANLDGAPDGAVAVAGYQAMIDAALDPLPAATSEGV